MQEKADQSSINIKQVETRSDLEEIKQLFMEYAESLDFCLCFQDFEAELANLPGEYAPPEGRLYIALYRSQPAGCVALRKIDDNICEMKRLYVRLQFRKKGIGRALAIAIIEEAQRLGYRSMRLDTVPSMREAITIYRSLGFKYIGPYRYNPIEGAIFLELELT